ncbi:hypothetical protein FACS18948_6810 [Clostridia bacterium]|nr:hypothetical protein FACS18948_6810 [Clostridia bacterium]
MSGHSLLGGSNAHRWLSCPPSARLESTIKDKSSNAAAEGSAAHALADYKLHTALGWKSHRPISKYDCEEMEGFTDDYVAFILEQIQKAGADPVVHIEQRVDFSRYVPDGFGTADCIIIADGTLHIVDFKYGRGHLVEPEDNPQLKLYALGALETFDQLYEINAVSMSIFQPRRENVSTWTVFKESLYNWAEEVLKPAAEKAFKGDGEFCAGDHCLFCRAAVNCRTRAEANLRLTKYEFNLPPVLSDEEIGDILPKLDALIAWAKDLQQYALEGAVNQGKCWAGLKLVAGRSIRKYTDPTKVIDALLDANYDLESITHRELMNITELERVIGKKTFAELLAPYIIKPEGKPALVPIYDKRSPISTSTAIEDFAD